MGPRREFPQIFAFCYHKSGTQLFANILRDISQHFGLRMAFLSGVVDKVDSAIDIVLFRHSLITFDLADCPYRGVRVIRDPRGIWLSGYWYHQRCTEEWCLSADFDMNPPIRFPRVPASQQHRSEAWKQNYLISLKGMSYRNNLLALDFAAGLAFEEARYADWTAEAMAAWHPEKRTIDVKMESIAANFDETMTAIFRHLGLSDDRLTAALRISQSHDVARMTDADVARNPHITSRAIGLWRHQLPRSMRLRFEDCHAALIGSLGYPI